MRSGMSMLVRIREKSFRSTNSCRVVSGIPQSSTTYGWAWAPVHHGCPQMLNGPSLLNLDLRAAFFELLLHGIGLFLGRPGLDGLGSALDQILGFLESEIRELAHHLDDLNFLVGRGRRENDVERRLLFGGSSRGSASGGRRREGNGSGGSDSEPALQSLHQLGQIQHTHALNGLD